MGRGMYALPSRPSKIVVNARIGPPKTLSNLETRDTDKHSAVMSAQKPVFNGNRARLNHNNIRQNSPSPQKFSPQHEEIVKYLCDSWMRVSNDLERSQRDQRDGGPQVYKEKQPNPRLNEFKAFNLDQFLGNRLYQHVTGSS